MNQIQPRKLSVEEQKLFDEHLYVAKRGARAFFRRCSPRFALDDLYQIALEGLCLAARIYDPAIDGGGRFRPFAAQRVVWALRNHFWGSHEATRRRIEVQGSTPIGIEDEDETDAMDLALDRAGDRELRDDPGEDRLQGLLHDLRRAILSAPGLDSRERRALRLRYVFGLDIEPLASRLGVSTAVAKRAVLSGVQKLRAHFKSLGVETLPVDGPLPKSGNPSGCAPARWSWPKSA